ncbi:CYCLIN domain-containing protein [Caenorhabditis elegans]|uniref:CYCLIN domain-containing protein n=1 Tax=Caenorhabditis elegans TaxID=6239 RepID=A9Z1K4_CAEEL|nr:CYCLIN domain-containing protein [Caenorhabditis elegans]CCD73614.1 CYCLIN domain-containing protein [Caenorhabditis elegans]|eukprot:NP_001122637.1 Uncharacterized protein CELE_T12C9.7 [Caenorhabditis elegans]
MLRRKSVNLKKEQSTETVLSNSQSPSFVDFKRITRSKKYSAAQKNAPDEKKQCTKKRQLPSLAPACEELQPKKSKVTEETVASQKTHGLSNLDDYCLEMPDFEKQMLSIWQSNIDITEMYRALCKSASLIPAPHTLFCVYEIPESPNKTQQFCPSSIEDRQRVLLNIFSRRFQLKVSSEALHLGAALLDKCLDMMSVNKASLDELAAVTLVIASKLEDVNCLTIENIIGVELIEKSAAQMAALERFVLTSLSFKITIPTPLHFSTYMLVYLSASPAKIHLTYYLLELSILYVHNRRFPSDVVANAATCLAFAIDSEPSVDQTPSTVLRETELRLRDFTGKNVKDEWDREREVMLTLIDLFLAGDENHDIYREYCTSRRNYVALRQSVPELLETLRKDST